MDHSVKGATTKRSSWEACGAVCVQQFLKCSGLQQAQRGKCKPCLVLAGSCRCHTAIASLPSNNPKLQATYVESEASTQGTPNRRPKPECIWSLVSSVLQRGSKRVIGFMHVGGQSMSFPAFESLLLASGMSAATITALAPGVLGWGCG